LLKVGSTTGIVGVFMLVALLLLPLKLESNAKIWISVLLAATLFTFLFELILSYGFVENFITGVLQKSMTLTGRTVIYSYVPKVLQNHWLLGYGFGSSYEVWINAIHLPNSQNGVIDCILEQGLIATTLLIGTLYLALKNEKNMKISRVFKPIIAVIYVFTVLSAIEITISINFCMWFFILYFCNKEYSG
jgi:O-antigen ligase